MIGNIYSKIKEYILHFVISCLILVGIAGWVQHHQDVQELYERIYLAGKSHSNVIVSQSPKKSALDEFLDKKKLPAAPGIPKSQISEVIEAKTTPNCPPVDITLLKNGTAVAPNPPVSKLTVENYDHPFLGGKLDLRIAGVMWPRQYGYSAGKELGAQISYWSIWKLHPDLTITPHLIGAGISYGPEIKHLENLYVGGGYAFIWGDSYYVPYVSASLRLGK